jgi:hypothetical protein
MSEFHFLYLVDELNPRPDLKRCFTRPDARARHHFFIAAAMVALNASA